MKRGFRVMDSDLHVIETGAVYESYLDARFRDTGPRYLGWSPANFPHWDVQGRMIPPWAVSDEVIGPQKHLDELSEDVYAPIRARGYDAASALAAMDTEGIDVAVVYRTFAHMIVTTATWPLSSTARRASAAASSGSCSVTIAAGLRRFGSAPQ